MNLPIPDSSLCDSCVAWRKPLAAAILLSAALSTTVFAADFSKATVSEVRNDVRYRPASADERKAAVSDEVKGSDVLRTGAKSMAQLDFDDKTFARLSSNSIFSFKSGSRDLHLKSGLMLFHVPKDSGGGRIVTPAATAAITGTTGLTEVLIGLVKFIFLEGGCKVIIGKDVILVVAGEMLLVYEDGKWVKTPIDLDTLLRTSDFLKQAAELLKKAGAQGDIDKTLEQQRKELKTGRLRPAGFFIAGPGDKMQKEGTSTDPNLVGAQENGLTGKGSGNNPQKTSGVPTEANNPPKEQRSIQHPPIDNEPPGNNNPPPSPSP